MPHEFLEVSVPMKQAYNSSNAGSKTDILYSSIGVFLASICPIIHRLIASSVLQFVPTNFPVNVVKVSSFLKNIGYEQRTNALIQPVFKVSDHQVFVFQGQKQLNQFSRHEILKQSHFLEVQGLSPT